MAGTRIHGAETAGARAAAARAAAAASAAVRMAEVAEAAAVMAAAERVAGWKAGEREAALTVVHSVAWMVEAVVAEIVAVVWVVLGLESCVGNPRMCKAR